ncbi:hypothetical protein BP5796_02124 [Coleophoma crateriformis]|uniref:Rhodanese domain-containing protein n=1 Tax=Coleophoma crateriformis TaxID=565419 RepID=A0A3D8SXG8_9HELO|nr:hypothetical protein BP5796_02124 [Coleophoma crateriformis]
MSSCTVATLPRISAAALSSMILSASSSNLNATPTESHFAIIDVRDDDHIGGHIRNSQNVPSSTLDYKIPELVRKLADKEIVVFHCALSQQRGPSAALKYLRERERLIGPSTSIGKAMEKSAAESKAAKDSNEEWVDVNEDEKKEQKVYVLDRGFVGWQEVYGEDTRLTEGYRKEIWADGY